MANIHTAFLRFARLRDTYDFMSHALFARAFSTPRLCTSVRTAPITGLAQGRIVSISRGSPPPKKR